MAASKLKFLILGKKGRDVDSLVIQLKSYPQYECFFESSPDSAILLMETHSFDCLVMVLDNFGFRQYRLVEQIRNLGYKFKIFVFADRIHNTAQKIVERMYEVVIFGTNYVDIDNDFVGICSRFIELGGAAKRTTKRKPTKQKAMITNPRTGHHFSCMVFNLSRGGAYVEYHGGSLNVGDQIKITVPLSVVGKTHVVKAVVSWLRVSVANVRSAGLKFLK